MADHRSRVVQRRARARRLLAALAITAAVSLVAGVVTAATSSSSHGGKAAGAGAATGGGSGTRGGGGKDTRVGGRHGTSTLAHPVTFTVEASGDLLIHSPVWARALELGGGNHYNFTPLFRYIRPYVAGTDLPLCHMETPMTPSPPTGFPVFNTPPQLAYAIRRTGWRACSTAATHSLDQGQRGVDDTIATLDKVGVKHAGTYASASAQRTPVIMTVKGIKVALLSYTELTNGIPSPHPWSVNRAQNVGQILREAHRARGEGAQAVIVNIHWGDENVPQPSRFQLHLAGVLTRSRDITAIVGQHVHVVQPIRRINGKLVVFGEGNLISNQTSACCPEASQDGLIALLTIVVDNHGARVTKVRYVPIWIQHPSFTVLAAGEALRSDPADAAALRASYDRTVAVAGRSADIQPVPAHLP
jgi:poly-gamma-glutamate synthesis protein (capsule biosynthesis protein)